MGELANPDLVSFSSFAAIREKLDANARILVIGTIGAGKSHLILRLRACYKDILVHSIDEQRVVHDASTEQGESQARDAFFRACREKSGIFEFTGGGPIFDEVKRIAENIPFDLVVRVHTPAGVCLQRVSVRTEWPPYPYDVMPDFDMIGSIEQELDNNGFGLESSLWLGQKILHIRGHET